MTCEWCSTSTKLKAERDAAEESARQMQERLQRVVDGSVALQAENARLRDALTRFDQLVEAALADEVVKLQAKCGDVENLLFLEEKRTAKLQVENARLKAERDETLRENDRRWRERRTKEEAENALASYAGSGACGPIHKRIGPLR